ncbi:MAG: glycosyltransferase family 2 protein [Planctomycetales bacterium]|nr:glycosyltransferase family 2 protein [Planctomycetales bacterium]
MSHAVTPKISIGMPVYNGQPYLVDAVESLLAQTFDDFELIIADNASTDETEAICHDFAARDQRVRYIRRPSNIGAAANFSDVMRQSRGEDFRWAGADDICRPDY